MIPELADHLAHKLSRVARTTRRAVRRGKR